MEVSLLKIYHYNLDVTHQIDFHKNGKANAFGWSQSTIAHGPNDIGSIYCGFPKLDVPDYTGKLFVYELTEEEWESAPNDDVDKWLEARTAVKVEEVEMTRHPAELKKREGK